MFKFAKHKIPAYALAPILYADYTGLDDDEEAIVDKLCELFDEDYGQGKWHIDTWPASSAFFSEWGGRSLSWDVVIAYNPH